MIKAVYVHIPFCENICSYCDFCKLYNNESLANEKINYIDYALWENKFLEKTKDLIRF